MSEIIRVAAPGKLFLGGEYAVLRGGTAVIAAVDVTALATIADGPVHPSPVIDAVREQVARTIRRPLAELPGVVVRTPRFERGRSKIGLGSSAAVAAASCGVMFEWAGRPIADHRDELLAVASTAHRRAQGGKGSGADVACSVIGGAIRFNSTAGGQSVHLSGLHLVPVWTGRAASTAELLECIVAFGKRDPQGHQSRFDELIELSQGLADAYQSLDIGQIIELTGRYGDGMNRLGRAAGAPIVTPQHRQAIALARALGGAAKPSGAGGGDTAVAVFGEPESARRFASRCRASGLTPLDLKFGVLGTRRLPLA